MTNLTEAIAACLAAHAEALEAVGTDQPELDPRIPSELRDRVIRQRAKVARTLSQDPAVHRAHVEALSKGIRVCLSRLVEPKPTPTKPAAPVWDNENKRWVQS